MASNYTENYQLNQWEPTDKVLREEFNADNAKVDAVLTELAAVSRYVKLLEMTTTQALNQIDLDLSAIDLKAYEYITIHISNIDVDDNLYFRLNNISDTVYYESGSLDNCLCAASPIPDGVGGVELRISGHRGAIFCRKTVEYLLFYTVGNANVYYPQTVTGISGIYQEALRPEELTTLNMYLYTSSDLIPAGVRFCVEGMRNVW